MKKCFINFKKKKIDIFSVVILACLIVYATIMLILLVWAVSASLKNYVEFRRDPLGLPNSWPWNWEWENYTKAFEYFAVKAGSGANERTVYLLEMFFYSLLYAGGSSFFATLIPCITGYATSRFDFKFSKVVYSVVVVVMALPIVGSLPSEISMTKSLGLYDQVWGVWILKANFLGMYYLVFYAYFKSISKEYYEAAYLDGAGEWQILFSIVFPLVRNTFLTIMLIKFIEFWNDFQTPLIYTPSYPPVSYGLYLYSFASEGTTSWPPMKITGSMLMMLPTLILFIIFHNKLIGNVSMGGIKE